LVAHDDGRIDIEADGAVEVVEGKAVAIVSCRRGKAR